MIPHDPVERSCRAVEARQSRACPRHSVEDSPRAQCVHLPLVAVGKSIPELNEFLVERLIPTLASHRAPACVVSGYSLANPPDSYPPEVLFNTPQARVTAIDHPALCGSRNQHWLPGQVGVRQCNQSCCPEVMEITNKRLELGNHAQDVGVGHWSPDLQWPAWTANVAELSMRLSKCLDGVPPRP